MSNQYLDITNVQIFSSKEEIKKVCYKCFSKKYIRIALTQYTLLEAYSSVCKHSIKSILHSIRSVQSDEQKTQLLDDMVQAIAAKCGFSKYVSKYQLLLNEAIQNFQKSKNILFNFEDKLKKQNIPFDKTEHILQPKLDYVYTNTQTNMNLLSKNEENEQQDEITQALYEQQKNINCAQIFMFIFSKTRTNVNLNDYTQYILAVEDYLNDEQNMLIPKQEKLVGLLDLIKQLNKQNKNTLSYNQSQALLGLLQQYL